MWKRSFRARLPSKSESWRCEKEAFVRDFPQNVKVEGAKTKLSCETSLKMWKLKMRKRSFRARLPAKSESGRCENDAFVQDFLQILKVQVVKVKLELSVPLRGWSENDPGLNERVPKPSAGQDSPSIFWSTFCPAKHSISFIRQLSKTDFVRDFPQKVKVKDVKAKLSCETPSKSESWRCENEAFARDFPQNVKVEDAKTKLSCETSLKKWKLKMWKRSFRARLPWNLKVEDVKKKLSCETSPKMWKLKMRKRSFRARLPSKCESWRCENEAFVQDFPQKVKVEDVKTTLSCKTSFRFWKFKWWKWSLNCQFHCGADLRMIPV